MQHTPFDISTEPQVPPSGDELLARLAGRRVNPHVPVTQERIKWDTILIVVVTIAIAIVSTPFLLHLSRNHAPVPKVTPKAATAPMTPTSPGMTRAQADALVAQARTAMIAGQFTTAAQLLDKVSGQLSDDTGASELRDENADHESRATTAMTSIQSGLTTGNWAMVHSGLAQLALVQPLTPEQQALDVRAIRESKVASEMATIRKLLDIGEPQVALQRAVADNARFGGGRFTSLASEARTQIADAAAPKIQPVPTAAAGANPSAAGAAAANAAANAAAAAAIKATATKTATTTKNSGAAAAATKTMGGGGTSPATGVDLNEWLAQMGN